MRTDILLNTGWMFSFHDGSTQTLDLPHTWNAHDGQNGGNDGWRRIFHHPTLLSRAQA